MIKKPDAPARPFIIAEAGVNHNGRLDLALRLVDAAARAGADAVKFQTFRADKLATADAPKALYQKTGTPAAESQLTMLKRLELGPTEHRKVFRRCAEKGILFMSTPFDEDSADFLDRLGMRIFKVPSGELTNPSLLARVARKGKPVILSTGMSTLKEVREAVAFIRRNGNPPLTLLHCVSCYPADPADVNLRAMATMARALRLPVGYSDHTPGIEIALAAAALGAAVIEKHFTLDRDLPGPDHRMSLEPDELQEMVTSIRNVSVALGDGVKAPRPKEEETRRVARRSIVLACPAPAGARLTRTMVAFKRPGTGIAPGKLESLLGRRLRRDLEADTLLSRSMLQ